MTQDFSWLPSRRPSAPTSEHLTRFWTLRGESGRDLTCSAYRVATGLELRAEYGANDIVSTILCRDENSGEQIAATADAWRFTLLQKGFREIVKC
jgi:hypothetical protein